MSLAPALRQLVAAHWPLPAICAVLLLAGTLVFDDYSSWGDEPIQRRIGNAALDYLAGDGERAFDQLWTASDRYYGVALEAPLALVERILGLRDTRDIAFSRHLLSHLFFLAGGVGCYLLAWRLSNSRALALIATALFLLHPRIYAHSFFNSKDVPFLAMFMVSLYLTHRAFRRDTLAAFLLCGAGVGLLVNLRIMGIVLFAAVLVLRALDLPFASSRQDRARILLTGGAFALAAMLTFHASMPVLWTDPFGRFAEMVRVFASHPLEAFNLFQGELLYSPNGPPLDYVSVWVGITTPPATLLLALAGAISLARHGIRQPRDILRNGPLRFGLLLLALPVGTVAAVVVLESNVYQGWRQLFFLYAPLLLLAVIGLHRLTSLSGRWPRSGAYALAGAAAAVAVVSMVRIHPYQHGYFNALTDRTTPGGLASRYDAIYQGLSFRYLLENALDDYPSGVLFVGASSRISSETLPRDDRDRIVFTRDFRSGERNLHDIRSREFRIRDIPRVCSRSRYEERLYASTLRCLIDPAAYFGSIRREALATEPLSRSRFDAYRVGDVMVYVRDGCAPSDISLRFWLRVHPVNPANLPLYLWAFPNHRWEYGFETRDFAFANHGVRIDGNCIAVAPLPDYPIARIRTGQYTPEHAETVRHTVAATAPLVHARFDIHLRADPRALTYVRDDCSAEDATARFFIHLFPNDASALPEHRRGHGFDNFNFSLGGYGARTHGGACVATVPLPRYPIASVETGQFSDHERLWAVEFAWPRGE